MQVEYEQSGSIHPNSLGGIPPADERSDDEPEEEEEDEEEVEQRDEAAPKEKPKRVIKQRQSLAEKAMGTTIWPMARVKKIIKADKELDMMTGEATFMIAVATEHFIKHFMEEGYTKARLEKRRIVNYKDMAAVVARSDEFDFLKDLFPSPMAMSEALMLRKQKQLLDENPTLHEDIAPPPGDDPGDDLPALVPSTNPLYPNAVVKKPPNTHAKTSTKPKTATAPPLDTPQPPTATAPPLPPVRIPITATAAGPATPRVLTGKNAPTTPHSLGTRRSARRSIATAEAIEDVEAAEGLRGSDQAAGGPVEDDRMEQD